jgi:hypothetical protein
MCILQHDNCTIVLQHVFGVADGFSASVLQRYKYAGLCTAAAAAVCHPVIGTQLELVSRVHGDGADAQTTSLVCQC